MRFALCGMAAAILPAVSLLAGAAEPEKYSLRYRFHPGETIRWEVEHRSMIRASVAGTTQNTETVSLSEKAWRVGAVGPDGTATIEHRVEWVDMRQRLKNCKEVHYDSRTDREPPPGFQTAARSVGVPLSILKMDVTGKILARRQLVKPVAKADAKPDGTAPENENWVTVPLPREPVPIGYTWSIPQEIDVPLEGGLIKRIKAVQQFTLEEVRTGVATIRFSTDVLTPVTDPVVESQLVQRESVAACASTLTRAAS